ncbi:DNA-binding protein [Microvirga aerilata]|uniref:DNA-binding protein n=1 Tax=Microvirga aerilata TaxID=670292 RepID=A0A937CWX1_9HYPH|nr:DNA-binding protein [Microvirga aerilata]MBL0404413.1 DNA-binding protein [Microvirga aerilata]
MNPLDYLITAPRLRHRFGGISDMTLWRWLRDPRLQFPKPLVVNGRRYWWLRDLEEWEAAQRLPDRGPNTS